MEGSQRKYKTQASTQDSKLSHLRSKYLYKMIHNNIVEQKHIRIQQQYQDEMKRKYQDNQLKHDKIRKQIQQERQNKNKRKKQQKQQKIKQFKYHRLTLNDTNSYEQRQRKQNNSLKDVLRKSIESTKSRLNTLQFDKYQQQKNYSNHIMIQNLKRSERYKHNISKIHKTRQMSFDQVQKRRQLTRSLNLKIRNQRQQKLVTSMCKKLKYQNKLKQQKSHPNFKSKNIFQQSEFQKRLKIGKKQKKQYQTQQYSNMLFKQLKAQKIKNQNINVIKQRMNLLKVNQQKAKQNKQNLNRVRQQVGEQILKGHSLKSKAAKNLKLQLEKYKQQKLMIDFLSNAHSQRFNQSSLY